MSNVIKKIINIFLSKKEKQKGVLEKYIINKYKLNLEENMKKTVVFDTDLATAILPRPDINADINAEINKTSEVESVRKRANSVMKIKDCSYDIEAFIFAVNKWQPAILKKIIPGAILLYESDKFGELTILFEKFEKSEFENFSDLLKDKSMNVSFNKREFKQEWIDNPFCLNDFSGKLKSAIISIADA